MHLQGVEEVQHHMNQGACAPCAAGCQAHGPTLIQPAPTPTQTCISGLHPIGLKRSHLKLHSVTGGVSRGGHGVSRAAGLPAWPRDPTTT